MIPGAVDTVLVILLAVFSVAWVVLTAGQKWLGRTRRIVTLRRGAGTGAAALAVFSGAYAPQPVVTVPVSELVAPGVAVALLQRILGIRRTQTGLRGVERPGTLGPSEVETLQRLMRAAGDPAGWASGAVREIPGLLPSDVQNLLDAVSRTEPAGSGVPRVNHGWMLMVRVAGEPVVENTHGTRAMFGKRRAMELLCWMALNRDRSTRSGARNAMWDSSVSDSTFTTIISDLRRTLGRLTPELPGGYWSPATFTDSLPLGEGLVTDVDVMESARVSGDLVGMLEALSLVRDAPFAGTNYLWADLDGSTTRAVITVMNLVEAVMESGHRTGDADTVVLAARTGLRVMPGDETLLAVLSGVAGGSSRWNHARDARQDGYPRPHVRQEDDCTAPGGTDPAGSD